MTEKSPLIFRNSTLDRVSSPEQLDDYLHVTTPAVWLMLAAVILLLAGLFVWSAVAAVESYAAGEAEVENGVLTIQFDDADQAKHVEVGMNVTVGELTAPILSVGENGAGSRGRIAVANIDLPDGRYDAKVGYKQTQIIEMLFN